MSDDKEQLSGGESGSGDIDPILWEMVRRIATALQVRELIGDKSTMIDLSQVANITEIRETLGKLDVKG